MTVRILLSALALSLFGNLAWAQGEEDYAKMMKDAAKYTNPGPHHEYLEQFIGTWDTEMRFTLTGWDEMPAVKGTVVVSWLMEGRWLQSEGTTTFMGQPMKTFEIFGYDNFKQSYVMSRVSTLDTAMHYAEGDVDPNGTMIMFGTLDEYTTGEHDKMVMSITRLESPDKIIHEVHDMPIGEHNTQVIEFVYTRAEEAGR